jgi:hypothetical protein
MCLGVAVRSSRGIARGLSPSLAVPASRIGLEILDHGSGQISIRSDEVSLRDLPSLGILVDAGSDERIVAQVAADVSRDDLSVDAVPGNKVFVLTHSAARRGGGLGSRLS